MYNEKRKTQFLNEKRESAKTGNNLENVFRLSEARETLYEEDLCDWNSDRIIEFYKYYSTGSISSLVVINTALREYTTWCMENGLVKDNQNHFGEISTEALAKCLDFEKVKQGIFTREELLKEIKGLPNYTDRFVILGLFEGIPNADGILTKIRLSDVTGNTLSLSNGKTLHISDELRHIMIQADEETGYVSMSRTERVYPYNDEDTILKQTAISRLNKNSTLLVGSRVRKSMTYIGRNYITIKNIIESGRLNFIKETSEKYGISPEEAIKKNPYKNMHEEIYGKVANKLTYWLIYEHYFDGE